LTFATIFAVPAPVRFVCSTIPNHGIIRFLSLLFDFRLGAFVKLYLGFECGFEAPISFAYEVSFAFFNVKQRHGIRRSLAHGSTFVFMISPPANQGIPFATSLNFQCFFGCLSWRFLARPGIFA